MDRLNSVDDSKQILRELAQLTDLSIDVNNETHDQDNDYEVVTVGSESETEGWSHSMFILRFYLTKS